MLELLRHVVVVCGEQTTMSRPTETQAGAFFGVVASALIIVLTAMALASFEGRRLQPVYVAVVDSAVTATNIK